MQLRRRLAAWSAYGMFALASTLFALLLLSIWYDTYAGMIVGKSHRAALVIGNGSVAIKVARMPPGESNDASDQRSWAGAMETDEPLRLYPRIERDEMLPFVTTEVWRPGWLVVPALLAWPIYWRFGMRRFGAGCCNHCGYDLRGTVEARRNACPECGKPISDAAAA